MGCRGRPEGTNNMSAKNKILAERQARRRKRALIMKSIIATLILLVLVMAAVLFKAGFIDGAFDDTFNELSKKVEAMIPENKKAASTPQAVSPENAVVSADAADADAEKAQQAVDIFATEAAPNADDSILAQATLMATQYDYDGAVELLQQQTGWEKIDKYVNAISTWQAEKAECKAFQPEEVTHVFFHSMVPDDAKAFDGDSNEAGYNQVMTTISEFNSIIQQMYDRGFVMVSIHEMCTVNEDGTVTPKEIYLPTDKKPFVLSQDDVSYYHYMKYDGFPDKLIVDENGEVKNSYPQDDGSVLVGDYDMVPLIDTFVKEHPDFSYHGQKGIIALTGYEGVLGYRTDEVYKTRDASRMTEYQIAFFEENPDFDFEKECEEAKKVADAMKADGWEFASHTWGHINPLAAGLDKVKQDTERWLGNVAPIVGDTNVLIFAFGADIADWQGYSADNEYFTYLKSQGFDIFANVDGSQKTWVQFGSNYMRQARRNLDGYRMYYNPELVEDLFDVSQAWDSNRPTPVPPM